MSPSKYVLSKFHCNVSRKINLLRRLSWFLPQSLLVLYLKSYVLPSFDSCDVVWNSCTKKDSDCLQTLFNYGCRVALQQPRHSLATALTNRKKLGFSSLISRRKLHQSQVMYNCLSFRAPSYLSTLFQTPSHDRNTRSSHLLNLPPVKSSYGQRAFSFSGASLWRSLPSYVHISKSIEEFSRLADCIFNELVA